MFVLFPPLFIDVGLTNMMFGCLPLVAGSAIPRMGYKRIGLINVFNCSSCCCCFFFN